MRKGQIDQGLDFKKRARRRLVGAIALVLLMVLILPMLLEDREKTSPLEEVEIVMPTQEALDPAVALDPVIEPAPAHVDVDSSVSEVVELALPKTKPEPEPEPSAEHKEVVAAKKVEAPKKEESKATAEKPKEKAKPVSAASDQFYVQIGVFSDPTNIKKLQDRLDELGYKSLTEKIATDGSEKTRLRTEAFNGRNEAAIALKNIQDQGLTGMVVNQK